MRCRRSSAGSRVGRGGGWWCWTARIRSGLLNQPAEPSLTTTETLPASGESYPSWKPIREGQNYGIKELHNGGTNASIDIVFVHGLTGNTYTTWLHKDSHVHWPSELLKQDIPDARILGFGYDADVVKLWNPASNGRLSNHAENMVGALVRKRERTETETRRMLFIAHSLGGLIVEKALNHSRQVERCTAGVVFLGVPHGDTDGQPHSIHQRGNHGSPETWLGDVARSGKRLPKYSEPQERGRLRDFHYLFLRRITRIGNR